MMTRRDLDNRLQIEFNSVDELVPKDHLVRKIDRAIDFNFIYDEVAELYSASGAPSIDPVVLIKIFLIKYLFGIPSMRQTIREIEVNIAYRWFIGYSFTEKIPHFSTFNKNYERRFKDTNLFNNIFTKILEEANKHGFIDLSEVFIDSTHVKASANKKKYTKKEIDIEAKKYQEELEKEIDEDRKKHGKNPLKKESKVSETKVVTESNTDPDSGMFFKSEKEKCFAYSAHTACDKNNYILEFNVTAGNIHDSVGFIKLYENLKDRFSNDEIIAIAMDAGYITPYICRQLFKDNILPSLPYKSPMTKNGFFKKYEYVYDEHNDCYICPNLKILKYGTTNRDGYREYKSNPYECSTCPYLNKCTNSKNHQKVITRHIWQKFIDEANHLRHDKYVKSVYKARKETIERVFADAKEKHGMRYTHLRSLAKITMEVTLIYACMNLKKIANRLWKRRTSYRCDSTLSDFIIKIYSSIFNIITKSIFLNFRKCFLSTI